MGAMELHAPNKTHKELTKVFFIFSLILFKGVIDTAIGGGGLQGQPLAI
jgi:hypothetical protein